MKLKLFLFNFKNMLKGTLIYKLRPFKPIGRGEYRRLNTYFKTCRIQHHLASPHEQMGSVERRHRQIVDIGLALLAHSNLPKPYWEDAFLIATYIINRLPPKALNNKSPLFPYRKESSTSNLPIPEIFYSPPSLCQPNTQTNHTGPNLCSTDQQPNVQVTSQNQVTSDIQSTLVCSGVARVPTRNLTQSSNDVMELSHQPNPPHSHVNQMPRCMLTHSQTQSLKQKAPYIGITR